MEHTNVLLEEEQRDVIDAIVDASGATARVPVLNQSEVIRALVDAGIDAIPDDEVEVEQDGEVVADGRDVADLLLVDEDEDVEEVEGR